MFVFAILLCIMYLHIPLSSVELSETTLLNQVLQGLHKAVSGTSERYAWYVYKLLSFVNQDHPIKLQTI